MKMPQFKLTAVLLLLFQIRPLAYAIPYDDPYQEVVDVTLVSVYLTALDSRGRFVTDLRPDELIVRESGETQTISQFNQGDKEIPLTVAFVLDNSTSIDASDLQKGKEAGLLLLRSMRSQDKMFLVTFRRTASLIVQPTFDHAKVESALLSLQPQYGSTALFDAVALSVKLLQQELGKKFMILFSDGQDNASQKGYRALASRIGGLGDVTIVCIGTAPSFDTWKLYGAREEYQKGKTALQQLADSTGGFSYFPGNISEVHNAVQQLQQTIQNQYFIGYTPTNRAKDGKWRDIQIECRRPNVSLIYRKGYFAAGLKSDLVDSLTE